MNPTAWKHSITAKLAGGLAVMLLGTACMIGGTDGDSEGTGDTPASPQASPGKQEDGTMTVEEFRHDTEGAVALADRYWSGRFSGSGQRFTPVRRIIPYEHEGEVSCGRQAIPENNAVYCPAGDFIAYDADWAVRAFRRVGDAFLYYLLGHEYAHAVQVRLGLNADFSIQQELQADCLAGAYIGDSVRNKDLTLDDGDLDEFRQGLLAVGDDENVPWFAPEAHGTPEQRTKAFFDGYEKSVDACLGR